MVGIWALPLRAGELQASLDARYCGLLRTLRIPNADDPSCTAGLCPGPRDFLQAWARIEVAGLKDWWVKSGRELRSLVLPDRWAKPSGDVQSSPMAEENRPA